MAKRRVLLTWEGKAEALGTLDGPAPPLVLEEELASRSEGRVIQGDSLAVARALEADGLKGQVDLVYLDPPYASGVDYSHEERIDGHRAGRIARAAAYRDRWSGGPASYLDMLLPRLSAMTRLLKPTGSIWVQLDWRASHLVRTLLDELIGRDRFLNEIVWRRAPNLGRQARSGQFGRTLDTLVVYGAGPAARLVPPERLVPVPRGAARRDPASGRFFTLAPRGDYTDESVARLEAEGRIHRAASGSVAIKYWLEEDDQGRLAKRQPVDALWIDIPPLRHAAAHERTGYPTQKPRALLERIIASGSPPGGLVVDLFAGSGTTGAAAARLGRRFILGDDSPVAVATMRSRLLREGVTQLCLERCGSPPTWEEARIDVQPHGGDAMEVSLSCRAGTEPIAWALSLASESHRPFRTDWHAERGAGRKPAELPRKAIVARSPAVRGRVYFVDGKIADVDARLATALRSVPTCSTEAPS